jgi:hypothetical protein
VCLLLLLRLDGVCAATALGPHQAAITALEGKLEAVRTAMTASVKLMIGELGAAVEAAGGASSLRATVRPGIEAGVAGLQVRVGCSAGAYLLGCNLCGRFLRWHMHMGTSGSVSKTCCDCVLLQAVADEAAKAAAASQEEAVQL